MSKIRRPIRRADANQSELVAAARQMGASVWHTHAVGGGGPDLVVGYRGANLLIEVKTPNGELTSDETQFLIGWRGDKVIVWRTVEDVAETLGAIGA